MTTPLLATSWKQLSARQVAMLSRNPWQIFWTARMGRRLGPHGSSMRKRRRYLWRTK